MEGSPASTTPCLHGARGLSRAGGNAWTRTEELPVPALSGRSWQTGRAAVRVCTPHPRPRRADDVVIVCQHPPHAALPRRTRDAGGPKPLQPLASAREASRLLPDFPPPQAELKRPVPGNSPSCRLERALEPPSLQGREWGIGVGIRWPGFKSQLRTHSLVTLGKSLKLSETQLTRV